MTRDRLTDDKWEYIRDLAEEFGPWETAYDKFNQWTSDGTIMRAHPCAAGGGAFSQSPRRPVQ